MDINQQKALDEMEHNEIRTLLYLILVVIYPWFFLWTFNELGINIPDWVKIIIALLIVAFSLYLIIKYIRLHFNTDRIK
jgi:type IV secretory pathway TrbL component